MAGQYRSIHGRQLGFTSTGGIGSYRDSSGGETSTVQLAQMWGAGMIETISSGGADLKNSGLSVISSDSTSGMAALNLAAPEAGVSKEIFCVTSASALSIETTAAGILFYGSSVATGSSVQTFAAANLRGAYLTLRGVNSTSWMITGKLATAVSS